MSKLIMLDSIGHTANSSDRKEYSNVTPVTAMIPSRDIAHTTPRSAAFWFITVVGGLFAAPLSLALAQSDPTEAPADQAAQEGTTTHFNRQFETRWHPFLKKHCWRCHGAEEMESGIRLDKLDGKLAESRLRLWENIRTQLTDKAMPPEDELQPGEPQRTAFVRWIDESLDAARNRKRPLNGSTRRLTVSQYQNTLRDLLGIEDDFTDLLPPDAVSKDGFLNNEQTMLLSPLLLEAYFEIAELALERCLVDTTQKPRIQSFRMELGKSINPEPCPDQLILGANSLLLRNEDFVVTQLRPNKPFAFDPVEMRTQFRFIEGYQGNATVRGWREYDSIYHAVFACMRGNRGYPKGQAYQAIADGLLLRPAIPSAELFQVESTYGPQANFKISLRQLPDSGRFRVTVKAARYNDGLLLDPHTPAQPKDADHSLVVADLQATQSVLIPEAGIYQVDIDRAAPARPDKSKTKNSKPGKSKPKQKPQRIDLTLGEREFSADLRQPAFLVVRLPAGPLELEARLADNSVPDRIQFTRLPVAHSLAVKFRRFENRIPRLGVHLGLRRDCGSTLAPVGPPQPVPSTQLQEFVFEGAISNFPSPQVEPNNVNYLAGIHEIGVRSEYTDGRDMPRLLIRSVEFEGPYYESWPPASHRKIFIETPHPANSPAAAGDILRSFATRAYRRPVTAEEQAALLDVWKRAFADSGDFQRSIRDALVVVLTSPQFLFLIEASNSPEPEPLDDWELASKLSYFLWNTAPDGGLREQAAAGTLRSQLDAEVERMVEDVRFERFSRQFATQWLSLDKFDVVEIDRQRYPHLTRDARAQLRHEPAAFLQFLFQHNLPVDRLITSDFVMANEVVASYYGLHDLTESGFRFVPIEHSQPHLGGVLSQAAILAGLSDGREANPVKRGAWFARKLIAEPPDDPPPNVPELDEDISHLPLRERLRRHREQPGCANCHAGIDPWGLPFESYDASGLYQPRTATDIRSELPDGTRVDGLQDLQAYLLLQRREQVVFSLLKHLTTYAAGRSLSYRELGILRQQATELATQKARMRDMLHWVVHSQFFLSK